jgi:hypothetical protein
MQLEDWPSASSSSPHAVALRVLACARSSSSKSSGGGGGGGNVEGEEDAGECDEYEIGETVVSRSGGLSYCHHVSRRQKVSQPVHNLVIVVAVQLACLVAWLLGCLVACLPRHTGAHSAAVAASIVLSALGMRAMRRLQKISSLCSSLGPLSSTAAGGAGGGGAAAWATPSVTTASLAQMSGSDEHVKRTATFLRRPSMPLRGDGGSSVLPVPSARAVLRIHRRRRGALREQKFRRYDVATFIIRRLRRRKKIKIGVVRASSTGERSAQLSCDCEV